MSDLIMKLKDVALMSDREDLDNESLKYVKSELRRQKQFDHIKHKQLMPNVDDMG